MRASFRTAATLRARRPFPVSSSSITPFSFVNVSKSALASRRSVHTVPGLPYPIDEGLGEFLSPAALKLLALDYQEGLLTRLNEEVKGTHLETQSVATTVIETARDRSKVLAFNYASQALNNSFFLNTLSRPEPSKRNHEDKIDTDLRSNIQAQFGSLAQLKSNASAAALGMVSSGWIWLVVDSQKRLAVVPTYGAGTMLVRSRQQLGRVSIVAQDPNAVQNSAPSAPANPSSFARESSPSSPQPPASPLTGASPSTSHNTHTGVTDPLGQTRTFTSALIRAARSSQSPLTPYTSDPTRIVGAPQSSHDRSDSAMLLMGHKLSPLFCISVHEHAWLLDYGVWGKEEYLKRFWDVLDWQRVDENFKHFTN